ncbi:MAG: hypothetical protein ACRCV6_04780 [Formosimonas sp.]
MKLKTLLGLSVVTSLIASNFAFAKPAFEVVIAKPKAGVTMQDFLAEDKQMENNFVRKQKGFQNRKVAVSKEGDELFVIVRWKNLEMAEAAAQSFMTAPAAQKRLHMSDMQLFKHYIVE